jgi:L-ascorbate metabolism protein UlaG (beta-lactamase superfamily)
MIVGARLALLVPLLLLLPPRLWAEEVRVTYLANEGVRIEGGGCDVLIDALLRDSLGDHARHDADVQQRLEAARPPFDRVRLALATHFHLDHWDAGAISRFLSSSPSALFASPPQAGAMIPSSLKPRWRPLWPAPGEASATLREAGAVVDAVPLDHGMPVENLGFRLQCAGKVLFHLGDARTSAANFSALLAAGPVDVALVPYWWLMEDEGLGFVRDRWRPRHVVAFHVGGDAETAAGAITARIPGSWLCRRRGESRVY